MDERGMMIGNFMEKFGKESSITALMNKIIHLASVDDEKFRKHMIITVDSMREMSHFIYKVEGKTNMLRSPELVIGAFVAIGWYEPRAFLFDHLSEKEIEETIELDKFHHKVFHHIYDGGSEYDKLCSEAEEMAKEGGYESREELEYKHKLSRFASVTYAMKKVSEHGVDSILEYEIPIEDYYDAATKWNDEHTISTGEVVDNFKREFMLKLLFIPTENFKAEVDDHRAFLQKMDVLGITPDDVRELKKEIEN